MGNQNVQQTKHLSRGAAPTGALRLGDKSQPCDVDEERQDADCFYEGFAPYRFDDSGCVFLFFYI